MILFFELFPQLSAPKIVSRSIASISPYQRKALRYSKRGRTLMR
jgi:hypothetical protein